MKQGLVSLLPEPFAGYVRALWDELAARFHLHGVAAAPFPHFTWFLVDEVDAATASLLITRWRLLSAVQPAFTVQTTGLGVFTGPRPVVYIPLVKSPALIELHLALWQASQTVVSTLDPLYAPARWMPHITLAVEDLTLARLPDLLADLAYRSSTWEIPIDQLTLFEQVQTTWTPVRELPLLPPTDHLLETPS